MGLSEGETSRTFKKLTGQSPMDYIIHYRIKIATILLKLVFHLPVTLQLLLKKSLV